VARRLGLFAMASSMSLGSWGSSKSRSHPVLIFLESRCPEACHAWGIVMVVWVDGVPPGWHEETNPVIAINGNAVKQMRSVGFFRVKFIIKEGSLN